MLEVAYECTTNCFIALLQWNDDKCILSKFAVDTNLRTAANMLEGRDATQKIPDLFEMWAYENLIKFRKAKCKVLHLELGNPKYKYNLGKEYIENSCEETDLGMLMDEKLSMSQQCAFAI